MASEPNNEHEHDRYLERGPGEQLYCRRCKRLMKVIPLATLDIVETLQSEKARAEKRLQVAVDEQVELAELLRECRDQGMEHHSECAKWEHPGTNWSLNDATPCTCYYERMLLALAKLDTNPTKVQP